MLGFVILIISMLLLTLRASTLLDLPFLSTFFELMSGPLALIWGIPPASHSMLGYVISLLVIAFYLVGVFREKPLLRALGLIFWGLFGFVGTFMYVT